MQSTTRKAAASVLFCSVAMALAAQAVAADAPGVGNKNVNALTQPIYANPDGDEATKGVKTLQDYIVQEKELFDFLFENHPVFKYAAEGRIKGVYKVSTRGSEFLGEGNAQKYTKAAGAKPSASQYRLAAKSILDYPNKFVGPERCGECHAVQYQKWKRSRHAQTIRFPGEHPEVDNDLKKKLYGSDASVLPDGITLGGTVLAVPAAIFALGMLAGAAMAHNLGTASSAAGIGAYGVQGTLIGLAVCLVIGFAFSREA